VKAVVCSSAFSLLVFASVGNVAFSLARANLLKALLQIIACRCCRCSLPVLYVAAAAAAEI
jgi:hypothetical protein